jgi:hypothetical protein
MNESLPLLPIYAIMVWTQKTLPFYVHGVHICNYTCSHFLTVVGFLLRTQWRTF